MLNLLAEFFGSDKFLQVCQNFLHIRSYHLQKRDNFTFFLTWMAFLFLNVIFSKTIHLFGPAMRHVGSQFPNQGLNPHTLHWKQGVLTTEPPGKSLKFFISDEWVIFLGLWYVLHFLLLLRIRPSEYNVVILEV